MTTLCAFRATIFAKLSTLSTTPTAPMYKFHETVEAMLPSPNRLASIIRPTIYNLASNTGASSRHSEQLPSIFELVPELLKKTPALHDSCFQHESDSKGSSPHDFQIMNSCPTTNSTLYNQRKRRRMSPVKEEDAKRFCERIDFRLQETYPLSGKWNCIPKTTSLTPDPSPSSRRSSILSSSETWIGSPGTSQSTNNSSSQTSNRKSPSYSWADVRSTSEPRPDTGVNSSPCYPSQRHTSDSDGDRNFRHDASYLPSLPSYQNRNTTPCLSRSSFSETEYSTDPLPSLSSSRLRPEYLGGFQFMDAKHSGHRGHSISESNVSTITSCYSLNSSPSSVNYQVSLQGNHAPQGSSVHGNYTSNQCLYHTDVATSNSEIKPRKRRGNLPKETTDKLRAWFLDHLEHPYPTEDEKQQLMDATGLQMNQISNWYINARRRQLPAMAANARAEETARNLSTCTPNESG
ncbi:putative homeobox domain-containing protein [Golovinomyces cichoracearum]|uniref:Putative homeobox domain-containing protein n=1 Tax=Golovinomyces cichoracearum TaxID=62708 RepID=A0A420J7I1_9PEZI|nr:putative homeobox domain-containing protein [Golovinomyces cichoracearum]